MEVPCTIRFIAFGAEEIGLVGSDYYVSQMNEEAIRNTIGMIKLDTIIGGDKYGNLGKEGWPRDPSLMISDDLGLGMDTSPGLNSHYPEGTTGDWDGYIQTVDHGKIWHTENDTLAFSTPNIPRGLKHSWIHSPRCSSNYYSRLILLPPR